jgi:hypothetical protein
VKIIPTSWHFHQKTVSIQKQEDLTVKVNDDTALASSLKLPTEEALSMQNAHREIMWLLHLKMTAIVAVTL